MRRAPLLVLALAACAETPPPAATPPGPAPAPSPAGAPASTQTAAPAAPAGSMKLTVTPIALPGAAGAVSLDYLAVDRAAGKVWVPAGDTGSVDVIDTATGKVTRVEGFPTVERETKAGKRKVGPSSATIGE